jgi:hypothetical protein
MQLALLNGKITHDRFSFFGAALNATLNIRRRFPLITLDLLPSFLRKPSKTGSEERQQYQSE